MAIPPLYSPGIPSPAPLAESTSTSGGGSFSRLLNGAVNDLNQQQFAADQAVQNLALGKTDSLHEVMLSVARADLKFRLFLEIRNRLTEAYQEIMRMPV